MLKDLALEEQYTLFLGLRKLVETDSYQGIFFEDGNPLDRIYQAGARGEEPPPDDQFPDDNRLFRLMSELSRNLSDSSARFPGWMDLNTWQKFCQFVIKAGSRRLEEQKQDTKDASPLAGRSINTD